jgi:hypothetical protein
VAGGHQATELPDTPDPDADERVADVADVIPISMPAQIGARR